MSVVQRYAAAVTDHSRIVIAVFLVATLLVGSAAGDVDSELSIASFQSDTTEEQKLDYVRENFTTEGENTTAVQVVVRGDDVLTRDSLLASLRYQRALSENRSVNRTLADGRPAVGIENLVATAAIRAERSGNASGGPPGNGTADDESTAADGPPTEQRATPSLDAQIAQLESMSDAEVERTVARVLDPDTAVAGPTDPYALLPTSYEPGSTTASGRVTFVFQDTGDASGDDLPEGAVEGQLAMQALANDGLDGDAFVFGAGIVDDESTRATGESFALISPVALLLILAVLGVAYRDVVDVALGLLGVALVLVWMAGFMGWAGIGVTQILIAVPFLLIGLSIDYALHVVMRYREAQRDDGGDPRRSMALGLAGVVVAIGAATITTAVGFFANVVSPLQSIRDFGLVAGAGILAAFVVFGFFLPALKVEVDGLLGGIGLRRVKSPFGEGAVAGRLLGVGTTIARRGPAIIIVIALVGGAAGGVAATDIDTTLDQTDFLPRDSPAWMDSLPEGVQPGDYEIREQAIYLNDEFAQSGDRTRATVLVEGNVTDPDTLTRVDRGRADLQNASSPVVLADGSLQATDPVETIRRVAERNGTMAATVESADTDGDGVPDRNLTGVYDTLYDVAPGEARAVLYRDGGEYRALRMAVTVQGGANTQTVTTEMRDVATDVERGSGLTATATGQPVVQEVLQRGLLQTLVQGFVLTLVVIGAFLVAIFRYRDGVASLGPVVLLPVVLALAWLLGTMYLAGISFTTETAVIASIAIGLGVDYAIHIGERYLQERDGGDPIAALERTVRGTGGALLASAVTTAAGFGVLTLALVPSLRRFGFVTATAIAYAFVASVLVLPSLLVLWERYVGDGSPVPAE